MKVAFYLDSEDAQLRACARLAVAAVREHMPHAEIIQLSSRETSRLDDVDDLKWEKFEGPFAVLRSACHALVQGECLFLDVDCIVAQDVSDVFEREFDIALPEVSDPFVRYTGGLVFSRSPEFWKQWADAAGRRRHADVREHLQHFMQFVDAWPGPVVRLPEATYERLAQRGVSDYPGAAIVHYRGPRKKWLLQSA